VVRRILILDPVVQPDASLRAQHPAPHRHEGAVLLPHRGAVDYQRQLRRFGLLILLALLFIPLGYIVHVAGINEAKAMNVLQIMAVFIVEVVRIFPWI
jgi:hypothetical protein